MTPNLVLSDGRGNIVVHPSLKMMGMDFGAFVCLDHDELIPLPKGSTFLYLPSHSAIGWDEENGSPARIREFNGHEVFPLAAFMIPGFTRTFLPAAEKLDKKIILPLWPYTAVGYKNGRFYAAAFMVDVSRHQRPFYYENLTLLKKQIGNFRKKFPKNRLIKHLSFCALKYNCRNAQNLFFSRWEAPLPVSPACNARCLGCLSYQGSDCSSASHERIRFVPTPEEVAEAGAHHLLEARKPMVSFGQGCEGEPLMQFEVLLESIKLMRKKTKRGRIHLNTNASFPGRLKLLAMAGLDSVRVSTVSFCAENYNIYYRPDRYAFSDVLSSIKEARLSGLFVSVNLLTFPGFTDSRSEVESLVRFLKKGYVDLLQLRNLSIDAELFKDSGLKAGDRVLGIRKTADLLKDEIKGLKLGYFNPAVL